MATAKPMTVLAFGPDGITSAILGRRDLRRALSVFEDPGRLIDEAVATGVAASTDFLLLDGALVGS